MLIDLLGTAWAILPDTLEALAQDLAQRIATEHRAQHEPIRRVRASRSTAVIPIYGILVQRPSVFSMLIGATTTTDVSRQIRAALDDRDVERIVLDIDSPGGSVSGVVELADEIHAARGRKPIVAVANSLAASAGYWIASQASEVVVTPGGLVGSIGVVTVHVDHSRQLDRIGQRATFIHAGRYKAEGNEYEPLGDDARAHLQAIVDDYYAMFVDAVARGRGVSAAKVRRDYGEGRVLPAGEARRRGLVDRIAAMDAVVAGRVTRANRLAASTRHARLARARLELLEHEGVR